MCLAWEENSLGTNRMGQLRVDWIESLYLLNGLTNGKATPNLF